MRRLYSCNACDWVGPHPSISDTGEAPPSQEPTEAPKATVHILVCPRCFSEDITAELEASA